MAQQLEPFCCPRMVYRKGIQILLLQIWTHRFLFGGQCEDSTTRYVILLLLQTIFHRPRVEFPILPIFVLVWCSAFRGLVRVFVGICRERRRFRCCWR